MESCYNEGMRIISKFQDYYDSALAYGFENERVLVRHNQAWDQNGQGNPLNEPPSAFLEKLHALAKEIPGFEAFGSVYLYEKRPKNEHMQITPVVFCVGGRAIKALWVLDVQSVRLNNQSQYRDHSRGLSYVSRHHAPYLPQFNPAEQHSAPRTFVPHPSDKLRQDGPVFDAKEFEALTFAWVEHYKKNRGFSRGGSAEPLERMQTWLATPAPDLYVDAIAQQVSIAVATPYGIAVNPSLKDWRFFKHWDAATCMQELSMFVGNMSHPDTAPQIMDDKYRVQSHGFNEQSFRKQPTKHGLPKRAKRPHPDTASVESNTDPSLSP